MSALPAGGLGAEEAVAVRPSADGGSRRESIPTLGPPGSVASLLRLDPGTGDGFTPAPEPAGGLGAEEAGVVRRSPHGTGDGFTPAPEPVAVAGSAPTTEVASLGRGHLFSIDVEDWFHILDTPGTPPLAEWDRLPSRIEGGFHRLLDLLDEAHSRATCFFLGYVAERFPGLVREALKRGHEVASHGFAHQLVYQQTPAEFGADARRARMAIEDAAGVAVRGYRCAGFSLTGQAWFFEELVAAGYHYDSSVFPASRGHGGMAGAERRPHRIETASGSLIEVPISVTSIARRPFYFFGGGYLRLFPYPLVRAMARRVLAEDRPVIFYVHPREVDPDHPRLSMSAARHFRSYVNLHTTEAKIRQVLRDFPSRTYRDYLAPASLSTT